MTAQIRNWWSQNSATIALFLGYLIALLVWGIRDDVRLSTLETRGSPQTEILNNRLAKVESQHDLIIERLQIQTQRIQSLANDVKALNAK